MTCTVLVGLNWAIGDRHPALSRFAFGLQHYYGLIVGAILSGVVGVGLYPLLGPRVWCRFFCPMAALLGLLQKAGRFRIRVKPDMCISCGNCSKRWNIVATMWVCVTRCFSMRRSVSSASQRSIITTVTPDTSGWMTLINNGAA